MPITVSVESKSVSNQSLQGVFTVWNTLLISGLTANADNAITHGLPQKPDFLNLRPPGGATSGRLDVGYET